MVAPRQTEIESDAAEFGYRQRFPCGGLIGRAESHPLDAHSAAIAPSSFMTASHHRSANT